MHARLMCSALLALAWIPRPAPALELDLDRYRGEVVYLDFWAAWCAPCRLSFPWMNELQHAYAPRGLQVVAVNVDRDRASAEHFLAQRPADFPIVFDPAGTIAEHFRLDGMPDTMLIDRQGHVRYRHRGFTPADRTTLASEIERLLGEKP